MPDVLLNALTCRRLPRATPLQAAGFCRWDLQQALCRYEATLRHEMLLSPATVTPAATERRIARARRNFAYLAPFFS